MDEVLAALGAIVVAAAAVRGARYLWSRWTGGLDWLIERRQRREILDAVTSREGWPNGAESLPQALSDIYDRTTGVEHRICEMQRLLEEHVVGDDWDSPKD